jgi:phosphate transport system permease protein
MIDPPDPANDSPMRRPAKTLGELTPHALVFAAFSAALLSTLYAVCRLMMRTVDSDGVASLQLADLFMKAGLLALILFALAFPLRLLMLHRPMQDLCFAWFGLGATFFGLAMLLIFFLRLGFEVREWFHIAPGMVERHNQTLVDKVANAEKEYKQLLIALREEENTELENAATDEEKAEVRKMFAEKVIPTQTGNAKKTADEAIIARDKGLRPDRSPLGLFGYFLSNSPSSVPQDAGIYPALMGSIWLALITILFAVPVGVGAAIYLEEYKANNWLGKVIQLNINNLAGVPSVVYGILGGFVFVELLFKPLESQFSWIAARNVLGGGLTLGLLTLPVVIVSAQEAIRAVPVSIRQGAYALGATQWQTIWTLVLPMASPGIFTGTILSLSRAIGEAAPLVLFGALLFVDQNPSLFSRFTVLPMQIFGWADRPAVEVEGGDSVEIWQANAAMASVILLVVLISLNGFAIWMRSRAQRSMRG